jgi:hypothetical protein
MTSAFATLRELAGRARTRVVEPREHCDLCDAVLSPRHRHLIDPVSRRLVCACQACSLLFRRTGDTKYKSVPQTVRMLENFRMTDGQWESLLIPIGLAFFVKSSIEARVLALYPSPAGSTESLLALDAWAGIVEENPVLAGMESDVEALLVNRLGQPAEYYLAPIDKCYELVGLIRSNWHGLSGGAEMWAKTSQFFADLRENAGA